MELENKFIVINKKRFDEILELANSAGEKHFAGKRIRNLEKAISEFEGCYEAITGKKMDQQYISCNIDEEYAPKVLNVISHGEDMKRAKEVMKENDARLSKMGR